MLPYFRKNRNNVFTSKGPPEVHALSTTFGPYTGKTLALYFSKNSKKVELKKVDLAAFYSEVEKTLVPIRVTYEDGRKVVQYGVSPV